MFRKLASAIGRGPGRLWRSVLGQFGPIAVPPEARLVPIEISWSDDACREALGRRDDQLDWGHHSR